MRLGLSNQRHVVPFLNPVTIPFHVICSYSKQMIVIILPFFSMQIV
jgi:hypothetical protein